MNENLDLTKLLKNCPKGTKLYSTIFGEVKFIECNLLYQIIVTREDNYYYFTSRGEFLFERIKYNVGECALFPSKNQRDWTKFNAPWYKKDRFDPKTLKPFDKVLVNSNLNYKWGCDLFSYIVNKNIEYKYCCISSYNKYCIPYNDDTKHILNTTNLPPEYYRYWED